MIGFLVARNGARKMLGALKMNQSVGLSYKVVFDDLKVIVVAIGCVKVSERSLQCASESVGVILVLEQAPIIFPPIGTKSKEPGV